MTQQEAARAARRLSPDACWDVKEAIYLAAQAWPGQTYSSVIAATTAAAEVALIAHGALRILGRSSVVGRQSSE